MNEETLQSDASLGSRVTVKGCEPADMEALAALMNLPAVRRGTLSTGYRRTEQLRAWNDSRREGSVLVCAWLDDTIVGNASLEMYRPGRSHAAHLGLAVHDAYHGRGVGTALLRALTDCADNALGLRRIELTVFADNAPAIALYRKSGFVEEGRSRGYAMRDGVLADALHMARIVEAPRFETI
jgi:putative acetyltransferase